MDKYKLEYEIKARGHSVAELCEYLNISTSAYYRRIRGEVEFTRIEIQKIVEFLKLDSPVDIFFAEEVS